MSTTACTCTMATITAVIGTVIGMVMAPIGAVTPTAATGMAAAGGAATASARAGVGLRPATFGSAVRGNELPDGKLAAAGFPSLSLGFFV
jgi:hypothetical protein